MVSDVFFMNHWAEQLGGEHQVQGGQAGPRCRLGQLFKPATRWASIFASASTSFSHHLRSSRVCA